MLPNTQGKRRVITGRSNIRRATTGPIKRSKFEEKYHKANKNTTKQIIVYGLICIAVLITLLFIVSIISKDKQETTIAPFNTNEITKLVAKVKANKDVPIIPLNDGEQNAVSLKFRIYKNEKCDESDPSQFMTIEKESKDVSSDSIGSHCVLCFPFCDTKLNENEKEPLSQRGYLKSIRIVSSAISGQLDLYSDCGLHSYHSSVYAFEGCVHLYEWPLTQGVKVVANYLNLKQTLPPPIEQSQLPPLQQHLVRDGQVTEHDLADESIPSYQIVYSCESSEYCAFQAQANYYGYLSSNQHPSKSSWLRLLTCREPDDMAAYLPTFTAPRNLYSRRYSPYNKADVLVKWYASAANRPSAETGDIIVMIDPDNWIIRDITHWIVQVSEGNAMGEAAWFHGSHLVTQLWKEVCLQNCDSELDMVGVPYIIHRNDLEKIAPFFKLYINIMKEREEKDSAFLNQYKGIQMGWGTEMFGYIFGAAHAGIKHKVVHGIQRRDVSARPSNKKEELSIDMIHMGRAWWPKDYPLSRKYEHTEGRAWNRFGTQVWCKCNYTASDIIPWPMPEAGIDFQSYHTLYLLHYGRAYFGDLPKSKYRKPSQHYHEPYP